MSHALDGIRLDKRFYLHDFELVQQCSQCGASAEFDAAYYPLTHPVTGEKNHIYLSCGQCGNEWDVPIKLTLTLEVLDG